MPSDLQNSPMGILVLRSALEDQIKRRLRRWFKRNTVIAFDDWIASGKTVFDFATVIGQLNSAHDAEALSLLDLIARLESWTITANLNIYVNTVSGSDENGDGSADAPLQTFLAAQRLVPKFIESRINIFVQTREGILSSPVTDMQNWYLEIGTNGQLTIQGIDELIVIDGPHTVNAWTDIGVAEEYGHSIQVAVPTWIAQEKVGQFIHVLTGDQAGSFYAIGENTTDTLYIANAYYKLDPGDTFEIVLPGTEFLLSPDPYNSRKISINDRLNIYPDDNQRFGIFGINFLSPSILEFQLFGTKMTFGFVYLGSAEFGGYNGTMNHYNMAYPNEIIEEKLRLNDYPYAYLAYIDNHCQNFTCFRTTSEIINCFSEIYVLDSGFRTLRQQRNDVYLNRIFIFSGTFYGEAIDQLSVLMPGNMQANGIWVNPNNLIRIVNWSSGGRVYLKNIEGNVATGYTVILGPGTMMSFDGSLPAGGINDIQWSTTAAAVGFPVVAGTSVNDTNGAYCVKLS